MLAQDIICIEEKENMENHFSLTKNWYILLELDSSEKVLQGHKFLFLLTRFSYGSVESHKIFSIEFSCKFGNFSSEHKKEARLKMELAHAT